MTVTGAERRSPSPSGATRRPSPSPATDRHGGPAWARVCPFLTSEQGSWRSVHASADHRCGAVDPSVPIAPATQRSLCLGPAHGSCATYLAAAAALRPPEASADQPGLWPSARPAPFVLDQAHVARPALAAGRGRAGGQAMLVVLMIAAFVVLGVARTGLPAASAGDASQPPATAAAVVDPVASPTSAATASPVATPSHDASASPSAAPSPSPSTAPGPSPSTAPGPSPSPSAAPTPSASPAPSPTQAAGQRYTVKSGDTLNAIAARFNTTAKAIAAANGITNPRLIRIGQVLIIPAP